MRVLLFDMEANGLLDEVTQVHCCVAKELVSGRTLKFFNPIDGLVPNDEEDEYPLAYMKPTFALATTIIGHNIVKYDNELLRRFFHLDYMLEKVNIIDTLIWSQTLNPDRRLPRGCPTVLYNPVTGKNDKVGPHSVAAWGYRVGVKKPEHHDWRDFSPAMLNRCVGDVKVQELIFQALLKEAGLTTEEMFE